MDFPARITIIGTGRGKALSQTLTDTNIETLADLLERLGGVPLDRIRFRPYPGTATEHDYLRLRISATRNV